MSLSRIALTLYIALVVYFVFRFVSHRLSKARRQKGFSLQYGCEPIHIKYPHKDPFFGADVFILNIKAITKHQFLETVTKRHDEVGETYQLKCWEQLVYQTDFTQTISFSYGRKLTYRVSVTYAL